MKYLPKICQGFLMSATLSPELNSLKKVILHSPAVLKLEEDGNGSHVSKTKEGNLTQFYLNLPKRDKNLVIYVFLKVRRLILKSSAFSLWNSDLHRMLNWKTSKLGLLKGKGLFFVNTVDSGYRLKLFLEQFHIRSAVLNAELPLRSRLNVIEQFNVGNFDYLIATDESTNASMNSKKDNADEELSEEENVRKKNKSKRKKDSEYGVARGLDFRGVSFVVNVDFPLSPESYTHRIGRTARGGAKGVAFSMVEESSPSQLDMLTQVQKSQPQLPALAPASDNLQTTTEKTSDDQDQDSTLRTIFQPTPLDFDLNEIEGFRYRVEDVSRAVTKVAVKETRAAELKAEILNSQRLQNHFSENSSELQLLRHDRQATHVSKVQDHLKNVPKYLLPRGMQVAEKRKRKRRKRVGNRYGSRRIDNDPLQSYDGENVNLDGVVDESVKDPNSNNGFDDPMSKDSDTEGIDDDDGHGRSTSGRKAWQRKHGRGKFSKKYMQKEREALY
jgi:ATP-dependent RNA helicase DDX56/DBP9